MSLPPMLLQRLKSRGLVTKQNAQTPVSETVEEIIAENYDEDDKNQQHSSVETSTYTSKNTAINEHYWADRIKERMEVTESHHGFKFCPNTYNIWHNCTLYCVNKWANGRPKPKDNYLRRYRRLIRKYPLGANWKDVYDNGCGVYYFYNSATRKVSWLPPTHPNARISNSAATFRKQLANSNDEYNFDTKDFASTNYNERETGVHPSTFIPSKKQKKRDLERTFLRKQRL
ncbi:uncharacterized protein LOC6563697 [Drosophila grimshawi]|uniref:GH18022 n=1 Tax=Drosophila grimshawi TaxID=7222 RepID=B4JHT3_DROGR|nr:uncharacterized protein LOC6563697 [Drosophila grimshawi]EDV93922.1 GH18022 [Drosophila grimshawi]